jgi:hypothetical protein
VNVEFEDNQNAEDYYREIQFSDLVVIARFDKIVLQITFSC